MNTEPPAGPTTELLRGYREVAGEVLRMLNEADDVAGTLGRVSGLLRSRLRFDAVGIRLQDGDDYPYLVHEGFPGDFLAAENSLVARDAGGICRDASGAVCLECTCGLVISGRTDPANPLFTKGGSCWTNDSFPLLDLPACDDPRLHPRNRCIHQGYASVALIPIRNRQRIVGLLQLNDTQKGRFRLETMEVLEGIAAQIGTAMMRLLAEEALQRAHDELERRVEERTNALRRANEELRAEVAERVRIEAALQEREEQFRRLFQHLPVGVMVHAPDASIRWSNPAAARLLGVGAEGLPGSAAEDWRWGLVRDDGSAVPLAEYPVMRTLATGQRCEDQLVGVDLPATGDRGWLLCSAFPEWEEGRGLRQIVATFTDVTERRRADADRLIRSKLESTGILAGGLAHDFNNLLTTILLGLELAETVQGPGMGKDVGLQDAKQATLAARDLTEQLITFAEGGRPVPTSVDLARLLPGAARVALSGSCVSSRLTIAPELWTAEVDEAQIGQVIRQLVLNAREALPRGGVVEISAVNVQLNGSEPLALAAGDYVKVEVADAGEGISPEVLPKVFDPYFSTKQRGQQKGMGLGLTICHSIVQKHRGAITIASVAGQGTRVHVWLPASRRAVVAAEAPVLAETRVRTRAGRVLVMDDELLIRNALQQALTQSGWAVDLAAEGAEAVDLYQRAKSAGQPFDLVILDLTVRAGMGGGEAMGQIRRFDPAAKGVMITGLSSREVTQARSRYGFQEALQKPFELGALRGVLSRVVSAPP